MTTEQITTTFISNDDFIRLTSKWQDTVYGEQADLSLFFVDKDLLQLGVGFDRDSMLKFLSTIGIYTIKIRFGIDDHNFKLILYGVDTYDDIVTPYLVGSPLYDYYYNPIKVDNNNKYYPGALPDVLAITWVDNWKQLGRQANIPMFELLNFSDTDRLRGYNYSMKEFVDALFPNNQPGDIYISFVLHQYFPVNYVTGDTQMTNTFGLIFQGVNQQVVPSDVNDQELVAAEEVTGGYYDFTAPCPRTC